MPNKIISCPFSVPCLGVDSLDGDYPIRNLSAEAPDTPVYFCTVYSAPNPVLGAQCGAFQFVGIASSPSSQAEACALAQAIADSQGCPPGFGAGGGGGVPIIDGDPPPPTTPCQQGTCSGGKQCVTGQCTTPGQMNDFGPVGTDPRKPGVPIVIADLEPDKCCVDTAFTGFIVASGLDPLTYSYSGLPPGLTGVGNKVSGTPTVAGVFTFTVTVTAADGTSDSKQQTMRVGDITTDSPLPDGQVIQPYIQQVQQVGGVPPISFQISAGALPEGLTLDEETGIITGVPPAVLDDGSVNNGGDFTFTVLMQDEAS